MKLISFLGTTTYRETSYRWQELEIRTAYSAAACCGFLKPDEITVYGTAEAFQANRAGLCEALIRVGAPDPEFREIPLGKDETELWQIFGVLTEEIPAGSEIAIDLTNGQRSLPAVVILASVFMKTGLNINVRHLFYGAFQIDREDPDHSPVFDLSSMLDLVNWGIAAERFNRDGDSSDLADQFYRYAKNYARDHVGDERNAGHALRKLAEDLTQISHCYMLLRPRQTREAEQKLSDDITKAENALANMPEQKPLQLLLNRLETTYLPHHESAESEAGEMLLQERSMIEWYRKHGHLMQAISLSREWLITWLMVQNGCETARGLDDPDLREHYKTSFETETGNLKFPDTVDPDGFRMLMMTVSDLRNDMMHAGKRQNPSAPDRLAVQICRQIDLLMQLPIPGEEE